jgi:hypothetical protein
MSLISTKGILAGAVVATGGLFVTNLPSAVAAPCVAAPLGSFATPCTTEEGFTLSLAGITPTPPSVNTFFGTGTDAGEFGVSNFSAVAGSFTFTITAAPNTFFSSGSFNDTLGINSAILDGGLATNFTNTDTSLTQITGTYNFGANPSFSSLNFTTEVPVPLPVVGAGLAFGFTRNLRKRAKSVA